MTSGFRKLRSLWIYPSFQRRIILANLLTLVVLAAVMGVAILRAEAGLRVMGTQAGLPPEHPFFRFMTLQGEHFLPYVLVALGLGTLLGVVLGLLISHQMAGPIYRMESELKRIASTGRFAPVKLRKGDYLEDLAGTVNQCLAAMAKRPAGRAPARKPARSARGAA